MIALAIIFAVAGTYAAVAYWTDRPYRDFPHYAPDDGADPVSHDREDIARRAMAHGQSEAGE